MQEESTTSNDTTESQASLARAVGGVLGATALLSALSFLVFDLEGAASAFAGGLLGALNLGLIAWLVKAFLRARHASGARLGWAVIAFVKLGLLLAVAHALIRAGGLQLLPLAVGYAALPLGIVLAQGRAGDPARQQRS